MNDPGQPSKAQAYLREMFQMNPVWQSRQIVSFRRETLGLKSIAPDQPASHEDHARIERGRERAKKLLKHLQDNFFQMELERLQEELQSINTDLFPELSPIVERLRVATRHRDELISLHEDASLDKELLRAFGGAIILPPAEAGFVREQYLQSLKSGSQIRKARRTANYFKQRLPDLFGLERDWLTTVSDFSRKGGGWFT